MYLLYADESGSTDKDHFVVGGLAVHEQDAYPLASAVEELFAALPAPQRRAELHARDVRRGAKAWHGLSRSRRERLASDVANLLVDGLPRGVARPVLFAVVSHRPSFRPRNPYERAYEDFFARCNGMLGRLASQGDQHRCVVISDETRLELALQATMRIWRESGASTGAAIGPMSAYAEVPLFVDSRASRLVQLADFVAYWVYRAYEDRDDSILRRLVSAFDQEGGKLHGLVHLVRDYRTCECLACASRRDAS